MKKHILIKYNILLFSVFLVIFSSYSYSTETNENKNFTLNSQMSKKDWNDPAEMERVWQASLVRIPKDGGSFYGMTMNKLDIQATDQGKKFPTLIMMHGCAGFRDSSYTRIDFPAKNGYAVIAPNSFAREKYPQSCDEVTGKIAMYRNTQDMRRFDAEYAIKKAKTLSWVDPNNVFLAGHSEGGLAVATLKSKSVTVNARIIEGWTCNSGWIEAKGMRAPKSEPVLALVGKNDPVLQNNQFTRGNCKVNKKNGSKSIVYKDAPLSSQHDLIGDKGVQSTILEFLRSHSR